jgi:predicted nucleic acid-binding protein
MMATNATIRARIERIAEYKPTKKQVNKLIQDLTAHNKAPDKAAETWLTTTTSLMNQLGRLIAPEGQRIIFDSFNIKQALYAADLYVRVGAPITEDVLTSDRKLATAGMTKCVSHQNMEKAVARALQRSQTL